MNIRARTLNFIKQVRIKLRPSPKMLLEKIYFGNLGLQPKCNYWGFNRGGPIDRYYIENFLENNAAFIKGHALEVNDDRYSSRLGGTRIEKIDILDINPLNSKATIIADLSKACHLPAGTYDCIILTQTLQYIYDLKSTIRHLYRILKPGGILLITVPGISQFIHKNDAESWCWRFTEHSLRLLLEEQFTPQNIVTESKGNVKVAAAFLYGIGVGELKKADYDFKDLDYQMVVAARAVKSEEKLKGFIHHLGSLIFQITGQAVMELGGTIGTFGEYCYPGL